LVGRNALAQALTQPAVTQVIAPTRKPLTKQDKLMNPVAPELELLLPEVTGWEPDAAICATGTTIKKAGSKEAFRSVDHDLPLSFARQRLWPKGTLSSCTGDSRGLVFPRTGLPRTSFE